MDFFADLLGKPKAPTRLPDPGFPDDKVESIDDQIDREDTAAANMRRSAADANRQIAEMERLQQQQAIQQASKISPPKIVYKNRAPKVKIVYRESPPNIHYRDIPPQKTLRHNDGVAYDSGLYTSKRASTRKSPQPSGPAWDSGMYTSSSRKRAGVSSGSAINVLFGDSLHTKKRRKRG